VGISRMPIVITGAEPIGSICSIMRFTGRRRGPAPAEIVVAALSHGCIKLKSRHARKHSRAALPGFALQCGPGIGGYSVVERKPAPDLIRGGHRFAFGKRVKTTG
jgi:hypothetical protein